MRESEPLQQVDRTFIRYHGRKFSYFGGCDYFRLASHPVVQKAVLEGMRRFGLNVAASRLTTGNHTLYLELERELAGFFGAESALLVSTGYVTNLVVAQALAGTFSHALLDARAHLALTDAAQMLNCPVLTFRHRDVEDFTLALRRCGSGARPVLLTDGMFSHDGSVAPLSAYLKRMPRDGLIVVDDAHGGGTLGRWGRGTPEVEAVSRRRIVQNITLSKAFGVYGGVVLCSRSLRAQLTSHSRLFAGSTPLPLPLAAGALRAVRILRRDQDLRHRLHAHADRVKQALRNSGWELPPTPGPIIPLHPKNSRQALALQRKLLSARILPPLTKYPGGPAQGYFRFVISSEHTEAQLEGLIRVLREFA